MFVKLPFVGACLLLSLLPAALADSMNSTSTINSTDATVLTTAAPTNPRLGDDPSPGEWYRSCLIAIGYFPLDKTPGPHVFSTTREFLNYKLPQFFSSGRCIMRVDFADKIRVDTSSWRSIRIKALQMAELAYRLESTDIFDYVGERHNIEISLEPFTPKPMSSFGPHPTSIGPTPPETY